VSGAPALDRTLAALADPARALDLSPPTMSRHLKALREAGLLRESHPEFDARVRIYELRAEPMAELKLWLAASERLWTTQLAAFKAHIERGA
jgi:DNA-binding transcriptional ArsR family regulator